jgi:Flp pilus assembly protein TadD
VIGAVLLVAAGGGVAFFKLGGGGGGDKAKSAEARQAIDRWFDSQSIPPAPEECRAKDAATLTALAKAVGQLGEGGDAAAAITILKSDQAPSAERLALLARAQLQQSATSEAATSARAALEACPRYALAQHLVGNAAQKSGDLALAETSYKQALAIAEYGPSRFNLGMLQIKKKTFDDAVETFGRLVQRNPDYPNAYVMRAQADSMTNHWSDALTDAQHATEHEPRNADAWLMLGNARKKNGKSDWRAAFCKAKELGSSSPEAASNCGE